MSRGLDDLDRLRDQAGQLVRFRSGAEAQSFYLRATGTDFLSKALHRGWECGLTGWDDRFKALGSGDPILTGPTETTSTQRDLSWELLLASLIASFATDVRPVEPPDIMCRYQGSEIGIAAKVLYSKASAQALKHMSKGAEQLEKSDADHGFVVVNLVNVFPHAEMFENFRLGRFANGDEIRHVISVWMDCLLMGYDIDGLVRRLAAKRSSKLNSILFFVPTVLHVDGTDPPLWPFYRFQMITVDGRRERAQAFEHALNWSCQKVLGYRSAKDRKGESIENSR